MAHELRQSRGAVDLFDNLGREAVVRGNAIKCGDRNVVGRQLWEQGGFDGKIRVAAAGHPQNPVRVQLVQIGFATWANNGRGVQAS